MRIGRVYRDQEEEYGLIRDNKWFKADEWSRNNLGIENFLENTTLLNTRFDEKCPINDESIKWLPPVARPGKIICVGRNYLEHAKEQGKTSEEKPLLFSKYSTSLTGHQSQIEVPNHTQFFDYEVELAVVMSKRASRLDKQANPLDYVFGYTVANDLTARDVQKSEQQWTRGKAFDLSLPIGPYVITADEVGDPGNLEIWLTVNGDKRQLSNTSKMIFDIPFLITYISQTITLEPGDIILTGTPAGVGFYMDPVATLKPNDHVACGVTGIGELRFSII
ncbi:MAG: fumarylacetoacetate hydrolase family protein [Candidatus Kariarchaeaceae archaeon]|jgi:acylpyruvate hydrolase